MKKVLVGSVFLLLVALPASAATLRGGEDYSLPKGQALSDNLYAAGSTLTISGNVFGDAILAGGKILINGAVTQDLAAAGGTVDVRAPITGDARIAGGDITIDGKIGGDLIIGGGNVHVISSAIISGDVVIAGGNVIFDGAALKNMRIVGGKVLIHGIVSGSVTARVSESLTVATGASIQGNLDYTAPTAATIEQGAIIGGKVTASTTPASQSVDMKALLATLVSVVLLTKFLVLAFAAVVTVLVFKEGSRLVVDRTLSEIPKNTILGFATLIVVPIACILLLVSVIGSVFGVIGLILYGLLLMLAKLMVGIVAGALLSKWFVKESRITWRWAILGVAVMQLLSIIPIIGWIAAVVVFLFTFGALVRLLNERYWVNR